MPAPIPDAIPDDEPIVTTAVLLLVQVPPPGALLSDVEVPEQITTAPEIGDGPAPTDTVVVAVHPGPRE